MALTYDYTKVANHDTVMFDENEYMHGDTQGIIFATMSVGIGELTDKTLYEFITRLRMIEKLRGWPEIATSRIAAHIGLSTNVNYETRGQWMKRWMQYEMEDVYRMVRKECDTLSVPSQ